ncbi:solute carrier family 23 protein [Bradyrhizobium canariense]|uniref:Xanthine/uracil/vitamin C permease, AzgA family n=1 Tax=Bradyrhizobium canariense TaxID=255045 RepID=A0A1H2B3Q4_9BRAD|nr:solute carrier family 23 protein [Bradyrhizobium canariense]SDT52589.1 Xanthine/uracil/vitamin C permease, AzgA family [Bradyrhizobium canariense]
MKFISEKPMWAGFALFFSMYYVLGANPDILREIGVPVSAALLGTFLAIIVGNFSGAFFTKTGLMIAPAIGISIFVKNFVLNSDHVIDWRHAMVACVIAGLAVAVTSFFTDWRDQIVKDLPESVKKGAKAGIGALLVKEGFDIFKKAEESFHLEPRGAGMAVAIGVVFLVLFFLIRRSIENNSRSALSALQFIMHLEFVFVVVLMSSYLWLFQPDYISALPETSQVSILWLEPIVRTSWHINFNVCMLILLFAATVWFIVISDIPGTPSEVLPEKLEDVATDGTETAPKGYQSARDKAVKLGYRNDGVFASLAPLFGTTPTIYYAENQILKSFGQTGEYSSAVGYWAASLFALVFIVLVIGQFSGHQIPIDRYLSPVAVTPILIFIGLYIISVSFFDIPSAAAAPSTRNPEYYFPTAVSVILTSRIGLEYTLPLSILSFWLVRSAGEKYGPSFIWISIGSGVSLIIFGALFVFGS